MLVLKLVEEVTAAYLYRLAVLPVQEGYLATRMRALLFKTTFLVEERLQVLRAFVHKAPVVQS